MDEMEIIYFENLPSTKTPISADNLNKIQINAKKAIKNKKAALELLTVSIVPPTECKVGDKYYNTIDKKIYTATEDNIWGTDGTEPLQEYLYIDLGNKNLYYYDGTNFNSYGGGSGGGDTLPIGTIVPYGSDVVPDNYLLANGQLVSRTDYSELFSIIGTTYGEGDGSTTFALPDCRGRVPVGKDNNDTDFDKLGNTGGEKTHTLTRAEMPTHEHDVIGSINTNSGGERYYIIQQTGISDTQSGTIGTTVEAGGGQPHNNLQPYLVTNYIIKVKMGASLTGQVIDSLDGSSTTDAPSVNAVNKSLKTNIVTGEETATNEYIDGKQVFVKRINCGNLPNATAKILGTGLTNITLEDIKGTCTNGSQVLTIPYMSPHNVDAAINVYTINNNTQIEIDTGTDRSQYSGVIKIYYTKN